MEHDESLAWQCGVPTGLLTVFEHVILVLVSVVIEDVCIATGSESLHAFDLLRFGVEHYRLLPSTEHLLVAVVFSRQE